MDTKLKNTDMKALNSSGGWCYRFAWLFLIISTVLAGIGVSLQIALWEIKQWHSGAYGYYENDQWIPYENQWTDSIYNLAEFNDTVTTWGLMTIGQVLVSVVLFVIILVFTGRFGRNEDGSVRLNWFDRIWSELHVASMLGFGTGFCFLLLF